MNHVAHNKRNQLRELHLFAGAGGGILGGILCGHRTVCAVEIEKYPREVLLQRQRDGILPEFPIWDDVRTFDGKPWRGKVDVVAGGFPCQDISCAGKGAGISGERSGLWGEMARIIGEIRPQYAFVENSPMLVGRGLGTVLGDLAEMGYDAKWGIVGAHHTGAPHKRDRIWILANTDMHGNNTTNTRSVGQEVAEKNSDTQIHPATRDLARASDDERKETVLGLEQVANESKNVADSNQKGEQGLPRREIEKYTRLGICRENVCNTASKRQSRPWQSWFTSDPAEKREGETDHAFAERIGHIWGIESPVGRVAHGVASRVDRLKSIGNGQVPQCAALAWRILTNTK
jgi:DNA (cytosine-5)-methyltransferase 1